MKWIQTLSTRSRNLVINSGYIATIGVSGLVLCAIGSNLSDISNRVNVDITTLGGRAFMARGIGSILGSIASAAIFHYFQGDNILQCGLVGISFILGVIPSVTSARQLYIYFFLLGLCSSVNDTGCNIMVRRLRGLQAGPWLGMNGISFGMSAAIVPIVELMSTQFQVQYYILSALIMVVALYVFFSTTIVLFLHKRAVQDANKITLGTPVIKYDTSIRHDLRSSRAIRHKPPASPSKSSPSSGHGWFQSSRKQRSKSVDSTGSNSSSSSSSQFLVEDVDLEPPSSPAKQTVRQPPQPLSLPPEGKIHYRFQSSFVVEYLTAICLFCLVGGQVVFVAYIKEYISRTNILSEAVGKYVLMLFWVFVSLGRLVGVWDQRHIVSTNILILHLTLCCFFGSIAIGVMIRYSEGVIAFLVGIIVYAGMYGPTVGYCHDLNNRLTEPTEKSTSICMFGLNCGASFVPYITASVWTVTMGRPSVLTWVLFLSMSLPIVAILTIQFICRSSISKSTLNLKHSRSTGSFPYIDNSFTQSSVETHNSIGGLARVKRRYPSA